MVQWLEFSTLNCLGIGSLPGRGIKIPQGCDMTKKKIVLNESFIS